MRHGALPAAIAATMTSSEVAPAGISCGEICSSGFSSFHLSTCACAHSISNGLFEYQMSNGPRSSSTAIGSTSSALQAAAPNATTAASTATRQPLLVVRSDLIGRPLSLASAPQLDVAECGLPP